MQRWVQFVGIQDRLPESAIVWFHVVNRLKALYRSWAIPCAGWDVYYTRHRSQWLEKIPEAGTRRRAEQLYQQLDMLQHLRQQARREVPHNV